MPPLHMGASTSSDGPTGEPLPVLGVPGMQTTFRQPGDGGAEGAAEEQLVQGRRGPAPQALLSVSEPPEGFDRGGDSRTEGQHLSDEQRAQFLRGSSTSRHSSGSDQSSQPSWSDEEDDVKRPASSSSAKSGDSGGLDEFEKITEFNH